MAALYALWRGFTCDLTEAGGGAEVCVPIVAPGDLGRSLALKMAVHYATSGPLRDFIHKRQHEEARARKAVTASSISFIRPDGREWQIRALVVSPGGENLVGYWIPSLVLDEAERIRSSSEAGITDKEQIDAAMPRLLDGGCALLISTPYDLESYMHQAVERNFGHPVDGIACVATTRQLRPDSPRLLQLVADEMARDPAVAMRDYECVPLGRPDSYFEARTVETSTLTEPTTTTRARGSAGGDLGFIRDGCALVIVERQGAEIVQVHEDFVKPTPAAPLQPSLVRGRFLASLRAHGIRDCAADVHEFASFCETLIPAGIAVSHAPTGQHVTSAFAYARDLMRAGKLRVLPETARQLRIVRTDSRGGPDLPRRPGEGHADLVSALVAAVWLDRRHGPMDGSSSFAPTALRGAWVT